MDEEARAQAVARKYGIPYASFDNRILKMQRGVNLETIIPASFAKEHLVLPLFLDGEVLAVAFTDPDDVLLFDTIKQITGQELQGFIATKTQILAAIALSYGE